MAVALSSLIVFFLANDLLLLNQFPDLEADRKAQRRHLPILIGRKKSARIYAGFLLAAYTVLLLCVWLNVLPLYSLLGLASVFFAYPAARTALQHADDMDKLKPALALNVAAALSTPNPQQQHILSRPYRQPFIGFGGGTGQAGFDDDDLHAAFPGIGAGVIQPAGELFGLEIVAAKIEQKVALFYIGKKAVITPSQFVGDMPGGLAGRCAADQIRGAEGLDEGLGELVADQIFAMAMLPDQFPRIVVSYGL